MTGTYIPARASTVPALIRINQAVASFRVHRQRVGLVCHTMAEEAELRDALSTLPATDQRLVRIVLRPMAPIPERRPSRRKFAPRKRVLGT